MYVADQLGQTLSFQHPPARIVSLVPSQTELLFYLGACEKVVGVTRFCIHPSEAKTKAVVGGTKNFDIERIAQLQPDLIIGNKEENDLTGIKSLRQLFPVWMSDIATLDDAYAMINQLGEIVERKAEADKLVHDIQAAFSQLVRAPALRVLYLIWRKPWMAAGPQTFIDHMLAQVGLVNVLTTPRYPALTETDIHNLHPDIILLSSEPYPFKPQHLTELKAICPDTQFAFVDGEMFSWYGSRLRYAPAYLNTLVTNLAKQ